MTDILAMSKSDVSCKVDDINDKYELLNLNSRLIRRREQADASLRDLDDYISKQILKSAMQDAGMGARNEKAEYYLELLKSDDRIPRKEARQELQGEGVPVEEVQKDFVSYQTVRKHLNECLGRDTSKEYTPNVREDRDRLGRVKGRAENVAERTLKRLRKHGVLNIGPPTALVTIKVRCGDCGRTHPFFELLRERECACADTTSHADESVTSTQS